MQLSSRLEERKKNIITSLMLSVKGFNEKHRAIAAVTTFFALLLIVILSALFSVAIFVCSLFGKNASTGKRVAGIVLAGVLLCAAIFAAQRIAGPETSKSGNGAAETSTSEPAEAVEANTTEPAQDAEAVADATKQDVEETAAQEKEPSAEQPSNEGTTTATTQKKSWDTADIELDKLMEAYPEMVGWVYFEDGHISYPIMQSEDNEKYSKLDYMGEEAPTGAIFLDYRSAADFTDANSIVYGHNMKDGTMFGSLREYRKDPAYYNDHMYFQIITPQKAYRYLIFEYMDVSETYILYDYVSDAALEFVKDAEHVRIKSYMDSEIPVNKDSKVVTLSTCTKKDDLQFVVLGVLVEESDR
ncbi:class B sortase [Butyrivibrio sp. XPD2006]|uniref:class B sortase n=1 Tax=Butyrivibrio sp. XPD2006 TaxID=1280668 RepID=UPI0012DEEBE9|nr:class B sortase [Butyrivibrio sp. XPD2006]